MKTFFKTGLALTAALAFSLPAMALTASQTVQKEVITTAEDGTETITYQSADMVTPGERIAYTLNYVNDKAEPATNLVLTMPVPDVVVFVEGSARGDGTLMSFSVDGTNFQTRDALTVVSNGAVRPASAEDISHIRWNITGPIDPGAAGTLAFSGTLK